MPTHTDFTLIDQLHIPEMDTMAEVYEHPATGARLLCLKNSDPNKVFGIAFRTPPENSTGVAHILEHSVLCGSREFPVKEPFVELLKGSLQTFLNALTFPDKTCYPVASANEQDLLNLMHVYLDAVFHPRITREIFMQEGWHYLLGGKEPAYKGVVYNEMRGAYSSPDGLLAEYCQHSLFPDTTYGLDSGGHPEAIPDLAFEEFADFHRRHYHPSNSYIFLYGDGDMAARMDLIARYLGEFSRQEPDSGVGLQDRFAAPVRLEESYPASDSSQGVFVTVNSVLAETGDPDLYLALDVLEHVLIGLPSSPLRKALLDSNLGENLAGVGLETDIRQMYFSTGLKGVKAKNAGKVEELIRSTLADLAGNGLPEDAVAAAMNTIEFALRENNTGSFPRGLSLMFKSLATWLYGHGPLTLLPFAKPLERLKARLAKGERVLEDLISSLLLDNPHSSVVVLKPDPDLDAKLEARIRERLDKELAAMGEQGLELVSSGLEALEAFQAAEDSPEDLARIPRLSPADVDPAQPRIPQEETALHGARCLLHDLPANGIVYLDLGFDMSGLPEDLISYAPIFGRCLFEAGTAREDGVTLSRRIASVTGGIHARPLAATVRHAAEPLSMLLVRAKAVADRTPEMLGILRDCLVEADLDNRERISQMALEAKASFERRLVPAGHSLVGTRLRAKLGPAGQVEELIGGVSQLFFLRKLVERCRKDFEAVSRDLKRLRGHLISNAPVVNATATDQDLARLQRELADLVSALPEAVAASAPRPVLDFPEPEGLSVPAQVQYVGKAANVLAHGYEAGGSDQTVARHVRNAFLWEKVRVRGGAYGAFCSFDQVGGNMLFVSYRDPNLDDTLTAFDQVADYLRTLSMSRDELEKAVLGAVGDMDDAHLLPDAKGYAAMMRTLRGQDEDYVQGIRDEILATTPEDFTRFAQAAAMVAEHGKIAVLGPKKALKKSKLALHITKVM